MKMRLLLVLLLAGCISLTGCATFDGVKDWWEQITGPSTPDTPDPDPDDPNPDDPADPAEGYDQPQTFPVSARDARSFEMETHGITHQSGTNADGGFEYIIMALTGNGFKRVYLMHMGGGGRSIRSYTQYADGSSKEGFGLASDNLPDWHKWKITTGGGKVRFYLDDNQIGSEDFTGQVTQAIAGSNGDPRRKMAGRWKNFVTKEL